MGSHPVNLGVRFLLEVTALVGFGMWGWRQSDSWWRFVLAIGVPLIAAGLWVTFAVPDDPSRSGNAPVPVPGVVRLVLELLILGGGAWGFYAAGFGRVAVVLAAVVVIHYIVSYDRIGWLLGQ